MGEGGGGGNGRGELPEKQYLFQMHQYTVDTIG